MREALLVMTGGILFLVIIGFMMLIGFTRTKISFVNEDDLSDELKKEQQESIFISSANDTREVLVIPDFRPEIPPLPELSESDIELQTLLDYFSTELSKEAAKNTLSKVNLLIEQSLRRGEVNSE